MNLDFSTCNSRLDSPNLENTIQFCSSCGCNEFEHIVVAYEEVYESERRVLCKKCGNQVNYWSYGFYENEITTEYKKMLRNKKINRII